MKAIILFSLFLLSYEGVCLAQWFEPKTAETTVLIEKQERILVGKQERDTILAYGTGFLLYNYEHPGTFVVVTCAHILKAHSTIFLRMNVDSSLISGWKKWKDHGKLFSDRPFTVERNSVRFRIDLIRDSTRYFVTNPTLDIGAFTFQPPIIVADTSFFKVASGRAIVRSMMRFRKDVSIGDEVYFVGFPFGIGADDSVEPLVRSGSVAWVSEGSKEFLLDAFSYGGNSGSPIFLKRSFGSKAGELSWEAPLLVGMIYGHWGSSETNFGLARCLFVDDIVEVAEQAQKLGSPR